MHGKQGPNRGADQRAHTSEHPAHFPAGETRANFVVLAPTRRRPDGESPSESKSRAKGRFLASSPAASEITLYSEHVLFARGHRPGSHLFRRPSLKYAVNRSVPRS